MKTKTVIGLIILIQLIQAATACRTLKSSDNHSLSENSFRFRANNPNGIYALDLHKNIVTQVVEVDVSADTPVNIKYSFLHDLSGTHFYYVSDESGKRNLTHTTVSAEGHLVSPPKVVLGDNNLNGPTVCRDRDQILISLLRDWSISVISVQKDQLSHPKLEFDQSNFVAADLHCREDVPGFFFAGIKCQEGVSVGDCLKKKENDSLTRSYWFLDGKLIPITDPQQDTDVTSLSRPKLFHRGDVDPSVAKLSDGQLVLGYSRVHNSSQLFVEGTPTYLQDLGYQKLMFKKFNSEENSDADETLIDIATMFREKWRLGTQKIVDSIVAATDIRKVPFDANAIEFVAKVAVAERDSLEGGKHKFDGILYGTVKADKIGHSAVQPSDSKAVITSKEFTCAVWEKIGLPDKDGKIYTYGMLFPRYSSKDSNIIYFSTERHVLGKYLKDMGDEFIVRNGERFPARLFQQSYCDL